MILGNINGSHLEEKPIQHFIGLANVSEINDKLGLFLHAVWNHPKKQVSTTELACKSELIDTQPDSTFSSM